jgi:signal transduction histidine kinase
MLIIIFVLISWGCSAFVLEDLYIWQKKRSVIDSAQTIDSLYTLNTSNISLELERIGNKLGAGIIIVSQEGYIKHSSFERIISQRFPEYPNFLRTADADPPPRRREPPSILLNSHEESDGNSVIELRRDQPLNIDFMVLKRRLQNNDILEIRLPLAAVSESAYYASNFMAAIGLLSILAGSVWAFAFARKFTTPMRELSNVAQSISQLDFSQKCHIGSNDEVGALGRSINNLSFQLNKAIYDLNLKNQQLAADVEKERSLDKLRKNFISSVSHELKTPISLILGYAEGLKENVAQGEEGKNYYCSVIMDEAEKMDRLVKDLLDLSQIESGYFRLERTNFDFSLLLNDITLKYKTVLLEKGINLQIEAPSPLLANGDELRIEQVIVNLLNNAIDHVESGTSIRIGLEEHSDKIRAYIFNSGKHIPTGSLSNLWLSFYKVDKARTRGFGGYGLGLSIVRAIQELHGNAYGVENVEGGVIFWFELDKAA